MRNGLGGDTERISETGNPFKMGENVFEAVHMPERKRAYVLRQARSLTLPERRKYPYPMARKARKPPQPRAVQRGLLLKKLRKQREWSQEDVRKVLGLKSREAIAQWERGSVGEIERASRLGLCKLYGIEERELLLDPDSAPTEFDMPLSLEAKSFAYRFDDMPEAVRSEIKNRMAEVERIIRATPDYAKHLFPDLDPPRGKPKKS